ncbi:gluconokinase [Mucilaginibacter sp. CAU 1740]|uniref:gluconokinase n=1 Tax=Mucilaginibacter sp. CAU 1740 TaxID=3140365 RepID=UPI00325BE32E
MQAYILGIDIGTGSTKAVAISLTGEALGTVSEHYPINSPEPGYSEQDPKLIWDAFVKCLSGITAKLGAPQAVGLSSAMHSIIPVNDAGDALYPMITWADARSENIAQALRATEKGASLYHNCGTAIHPMSPLSKLLWLKDNESEIFNAAHKFISIKEYIWFKLFGVFEVDYSIASATGMFDIVAKQWSNEALDLIGIPASKLSQPVNTTYYRANVNQSVVLTTGIATQTPFVAGASDGACANLGSHTTGEGIAALTIGTSGAVRITHSKPFYNYEAMVFNYLLDEQTFVCGGAVNNGGIALNWLLKNFLKKENPGSADYNALFAEIAAVPAGSEGLIFLPYLYGERAPLWDTKTSGTFFNVKPAHTRSHFLRAGLEGICFALNDVLKTLEDASGEITQVNISGGFTSSAVWTQVLADITGKKLAVLQSEDSSAMGAIYLAARVIHPQSYEQLTKVEHQQIIQPSENNHAVYSRMFPVFKKLYADLKDTMHLVDGWE